MNKTYTLLSLCTLLTLGFFMPPAGLYAQITNGQVNYELRVDQWRQTCDNDGLSDDDNEIRIGLSSDGNSGGTASWTSGGNGASCGGNLYVRRWQDDAPSTVTNSNTLLYYCANRNNNNDNFSIYYNSWEEDGSPDCDPGGDACQSSGTYAYTFKSAAKTPSLWWGYTGTSGGSFMTGNSGDFFAKTVWRYTYGDGCGSSLNFGTLSSGTTYSHVNSNRPTPGGASGNMGYSNVSGNASQDVFYQFTISVPASVVISTNNSGTDYDTYLRLYNSTSCGTQIAFNDDFGGSTRSTINMDLCAGTYVVQVEGFSTNIGNFNLSVQATNRPVNGGTIAGITNGAAICPGDDPGAFTSSVDATGAGGVSYQWESSTTGAGSGYSNIGGQTGNTYDPGALTQTTWFRRRATDGCGQSGYSNVIQVVVNTTSTAPTAITGTTTICAGGSTTLTLSGGSAGTGAVAQWFSGSCGGTLVGTGSSISVSPSSSTTYFVRYAGTCNTTTCASVTVTVNTLSTAPTAITGTTTICAGGSTTLTLSGGSAGTGAVAQWFSGSCGGTLAGTGNSISVSPSSSTTYFVRYAGTCNTTTCASVTVTVNTLSTAPTAITGTTTICAGGSTTLTLSGGSAGTGAVAQWFSGSCGGTLAGTGNSITVSPASNTTYFVRYSGSCNTTTCASATVTVNTVSAAPTGISGTTSICAGGSTTLTLTGGSAGTGAVAEWFSGSCGGTLAGTGNSITVSPASNTTYFVRYSGSCNITSCASATVTVNAAPANFTPLVLTSTPLCYRGNAQVSSGGSQSGVTYQLRDNTTNVGASQTGNGSALTFLSANLTANASAYNILATTGAGCTLSVNVPAIMVTAAPMAIGNNNDTRTCYVNNNNNFVEFVTSNRDIIAINPGSQDLGNVTVTEYVDGTPISVQACNTTQPELMVAALNRRWVISSTVPPVSPVSVRLYLADADVTALATVANTNLNSTDDVSGLGSLQLTKYSGPNENSTFTDNCNAGGTVTLYTPGASGGITAPIAGNSIAASSYISFSIPGFSELWLNGTSISSPLPVTLNSFDVVCKEGRGLISWSTVSEVNNAYFTVERSADAQNWEILQTVNGAGNSNSLLTYNVTDERPENGITYYRLRQTDYNGDEELFTEKSIFCTSEDKASLHLFPNPAQDLLNIRFYLDESSDLEMSIYDARGARLQLQKWNGIPQGELVRTIVLSDMAPGVYSLRLRTGKGLYTAAFIKR